MTKKQATQELVAQETNNLPMHQLGEADLNQWVDSQADSADIIIPKLILMQSNSELVANRVAGTGDFVRSTDKKNLGNNLKIIPFHKSVSWVELKLTGGKYKWNREYPHTPENAAQEWEFVDESNTPCKRQKAFNYYCMLAQPEADDTELPIVKVQFKSGSVKAGANLADYFAKIKVMNTTRKMQGKTLIVPASYVWTLSSEGVKGESGMYQKFNVAKGDATPTNLLVECMTWFKTIHDAKNVVEHNDPATEAE